VLPPIKYTEFKLKNGLRVIFHEDHSTPIVAVNIWYHVGSKNEVPGRTGFAHLFEHMMFQGSLHHDTDYFVPLQEAGGTLNGSTNADRTNYWEVVPANFLELALWLEADRMGYLLEALTERKLANQREVVKNEKRQNYDNRPYGLVGAKIAETLYPPAHPYHWLTIGSLDDLNAASVDDISEFFRRYYTPNNASLVVAGAFNQREARALVEKYFGPLKPGPEVVRPSVPQPALDHELRLTMEDRVSLPRVYLTWHSSPQWSADEAALDTLAFVLAGGKGSRLYKSLVYEQQIAQDATAFNNARELAGQFQIIATARPGQTLEELEQAIEAELMKLKREPPTVEEMERGYNAREASFIYSLQTVGGFGGKSDQLNQYAVFTGQPDYFQRDLERYRRVSAADVRAAANKYLTGGRLILAVTPRAEGKQTTGDPIPAGPAGAIAAPSQQTAGAIATGTTTAASQTTRPVATQTSTLLQTAGVEPQTRAEAAATTPAGATPPATTIQRAGQPEKPDKLKLGGLSLAPAPKPDPVFTLPQLQRYSLSNGLEVLIVEQHELPVVQLSLVLKTGGAADPQERAGLASLTAALIDEGTKTRSALDISNQLSAIGASLGSGADWDYSSLNLLTLTKHLDRALDIYTDVINHPTFPEHELKLQRNSRLAVLLQRRDNADAIAALAYTSLLYGHDHPYGRSIIGDESSIAVIQDADVRRFYDTYYHPNNASLIIVGDVRPETLLPQLEHAFAEWKSADVPAIRMTEPRERKHAQIYLVDKPGAAQSIINIGQVSASRSTPDYFPLVVMNTLLGGQFTSRINMNLREDKGYTYGARTVFDFRRGPGLFVATAGVQTEVTTEAVAEFMKELRGIRGPRPVTPAELAFAKQAIIRGFPRSFETPDQIAGRLAAVVIYSLPDSYFNDYIPQVRAVNLEDVTRVAAAYLDPSKMAILVVGDRKVIEPQLRSLPAIGPSLTLVDTEGRKLNDE
jgi:zinc protease